MIEFRMWECPTFSLPTASRPTLRERHATDGAPPVVLCQRTKIEDRATAQYQLPGSVPKLTRAGRAKR